MLFSCSVIYRVIPSSPLFGRFLTLLVSTESASLHERTAGSSGSADGAAAPSRYLIMASRWYEGLPMVLIEALALGTLVIAPDHGAFSEVIASGGTKFLFRPGEEQDLAKTLSYTI
jgi:hypothetical protein